MRKSRSRDIKPSLQDTIDSVNAIRRYIGTMSFDEFVIDDKTQAAVERKFLIISETAIRLGENAERLCPGLEWHQIRGLGNLIRHEYGNINVAAIWAMVQEDLPPLSSSVNKAIASIATISEPTA